MNLIDTMVGEYRLLSLLGQGGMGEVYEAKHPIIGKRVAVKVLKRELVEDASLSLRFIEEARAVNGIRHQAIVDVFGFGTLPNGQLYLVMDLLEGESFSAYLKEHAPLEPLEAMRWLIELLDAIAAAHDAGVVHRVLKPSNLFLVGPRGKRTLKVLDFGIARRLKRDEQLTRPNMLLGSPSYVSPEQIRGEAHFQSDLYAIGCMAWAMLVGRTLFKGEVLDVLNQHLFEKPVAPGTLVPGITPALDAFVLKLLEKEPKDRPASAAVARDELRVLAHGAESPTTQRGRPVLATRETGVPAARTLAEDEPAETREHKAPETETANHRRPVTETAPELQRPAPPEGRGEGKPTTDTAPELVRPTNTIELEPPVAPRSNVAGILVVLGVLLLLGGGVYLATGTPTTEPSRPSTPLGVNGTPAPMPPTPTPSPTPIVPSEVEGPAPTAVTETPKRPAPPPRPARVTPPPRPTPEELPSRGRTATAPSASTLEARLKTYEAAVSAGATKGGRLAATMMLDEIRTFHAKSATAADRVETEALLDRWARKYLP
ncbi:MAG: serine/threonine-protein kinase [Archangium sp.]|nr:serine/threonine-protein kinase [Archangium sp.]